MKDVRVPGIVWAIGIIVAIALIHSNGTWLEATTGLGPVVWDAIVAILIGALKGINLGTDQLNQALSIIEEILKRQRLEFPRVAEPGEGMRGSISGTPPLTGVPLEMVPERPNPWMRWLVG